MEFENGQRGSKICIYNSHRYRHIRNNKNGTESWRCTNRKCSAAILIHPNKSTIEKGQHQHEPHQSLEQQCVRGMKRRAEQETTPIPKIYEEESVKFYIKTGGILKTFDSLRSSLYRSLNSTLPVLPSNLKGFDVPDEWKKDNLDGDFLQIYVGTEARVLGFISQHGLQRLSEAKHWNVDGTFYTAPRLFTQALTIQGLTGPTIKPCLFAALPDKNQRTYTMLINSLNELSWKNNIILNPDTIMMDFETATINSFESIYPNSSCKGCYFHYRQNLYKHIGKKGMH